MTDGKATSETTDGRSTMETLVEAIARLRAAGYVRDFTVTAEGAVLCPGCGAVHEPESLHVDESVRFEGASDPGDEAIALALHCDCGEYGIYTAAFGPGATAADAKLLRRLG